MEVLALAREYTLSTMMTFILLLRYTLFRAILYTLAGTLDLLQLCIVTELPPGSVAYIERIYR